MPYKNTYVRNPLVSENVFRTFSYKDEEVPLFEKVKKFIPHPSWENHKSAIECYWKAWELAFRNIKKPTLKNGFITNYIDTAYNGNLFMWDSAFILLFARYGNRIFNFQKTLDNFYHKQHPDGFICREINGTGGKDCFERFDPVSTGPNILPWAEWEYFLNFGDVERLENIFPVLSAYHLWLRQYRTWQNGTYWASGWASGMDNQPRLPAGYNVNFSNGHMTWLDTCLQQILSGKILIRIGEVLERWQEIEEIEDEIEFLTAFVNKKMWNDKKSFYFDLYSDGALNYVKSIGAYWALISDVIPEEKLERFIEHLNKPEEFNRPHRVPSLSADHPKYKSKGRYWVGGVWAPTNYMVLRGLTLKGFDKLAHEIALNHHTSVVKIFEETGTLWENYAPEFITPAKPAKPDFVGWTGLSPIAILFENIFGIRADVPNNSLIWDVRLLEKYGIANYPFGKNGVLNLMCEKRSSQNEKPLVKIKSNIDFKLQLKWGDKKVSVDIKKNV